MFSETHSDSQRADRILASIRREEARPGRGLLKIFFGMAPGVGKTCAMLEAAIQAADKGVQSLSAWRNPMGGKIRCGSLAGCRAFP